MSQYPPARIARAGAPAPSRGAGTGLRLPASADPIEAAVTHSTAKARGVTRFSFVVNISNDPP